MYKIDKADEAAVAEFTWREEKHAGTSYMRTWIPGSKNPRLVLYMHQLIIGHAPEGMVTDHKDRDGLNNRRSNLHHVTRAVNRINSKMNSNNKTGYRGVVMRGARYRAQIFQRPQTNTYLGTFDTPQEAHQAYLAAHNRIYGGAHARD